ncbi:unnamed protein product [Macrosiphum euphorbiae]|uniref:Uncharacterized protein n=1 Tax=Macrosiphum euphorbiae TaxID=13131 RepID=A0AAV0Y4B3_9HEMI|nr:unnamed protein product [Macrosiphum euphorbiae]
METTIKDFNKLQENEMQNEIEKSLLNNEIIVKFCKYEYYNTNNKKNIKIMKYNLNTIPIKGNILIIDHGHNISGNGKPYASKILESPTWLEICKIANDLINTTGTYFFKYLHDICVVQDLGNIKICCLGMGGIDSDHKMLRI